MLWGVNKMEDLLPNPLNITQMDEFFMELEAEEIEF